MTFLWPPMLLSLACIPLGVAAAVAIGRRRRRWARTAGLDLGRHGTRGATGWRGRLPVLLFLAGFAALGIALARPQGVLSVPQAEGSVILAFDVSGSMAATDVAPTRLDAAKAAATEFVQRQPDSVVVGVVAFSDSGVSVQAPTHDTSAVLAAIGRLAPQRGTSLAQGIQAALGAIDLAENGPRTNYYSNRSPAPSPSPTPAPVPPGSHRSAVIVLLTDGENNENPDPAMATQAAADRGIRIFTVGIGSAGGTTLDLNGFRVHTQLHADALQQISQVTGGTYYAAASQQDLHGIYDQIDSRLVVKPEAIEITSVVAGASVVLLVGGALASLAWLGRLP